MGAFMTEDQKQELWELRAEWIGVYGVMFSGVRWYARRIDHFSTGADDWVSGATAGELGERLAADYEAGALHQ